MTKANAKFTASSLDRSRLESQRFLRRNILSPKSSGSRLWLLISFHKNNKRDPPRGCTSLSSKSYASVLNYCGLHPPWHMLPRFSNLRVLWCRFLHSFWVLLFKAEDFFFLERISTSPPAVPFVTLCHPWLAGLLSRCSCKHWHMISMASLCLLCGRLSCDGDTGSTRFSTIGNNIAGLHASPLIIKLIQKTFLFSILLLTIYWLVVSFGCK